MDIEELKLRHRKAQLTGNPTDELKFGRMLLEAEKNDAAANQGVDFDFGTMVSNIPSSLYNVAADTAQAVMNPVDTAYAAGNLIRSGVRNAQQEVEDYVGPEIAAKLNRFGNAIASTSPFLNITAERRPESAEEIQRNPTVSGQEEGEAFAGALDDRYGSVDNAKTTLMEDPAGMLLDVSSVLTGAGAAARSPRLANMGSQISPLSGSIRAPVAALERGMGRPLSRKLYQSGMKPTGFSNMPLAEQNRLLDLGIELDATPTTRSANKLERKRNELGQEIADVEQSINKPGVLIDTERLFDKVGEVESKYVPDNPNAAANMEKIDKVVEDMIEGLFLGGGRPDPARVAKIKRNIYNTVSYDKKSNANNRQIDDVQEATLKAIAAAAREQLEMLDPRLAGLNEQYGKIKDVQKLQNPAMVRVGNRDVVGIGAPVKAGAGAAAAGDVGATLGFLQSLVDAPTFKTNLGIGANRAGQLLRNPTYQKLELAAGQGGRLEEEALSQFDRDMDAILSGMLDTRKVK